MAISNYNLKITEKLNALQLQNLKPILMRVGHEIIAETINRTQSGKDLNGKSFNAYTKPYAKQKAKEYKTTTVNLTRTEKMLNAMTPEEITNGIEIKFNSTEQATKAYHNQITNDREFFGLNEKQKQYILNELKKQIS